ncbi:MAG: ferritin-like domain-containing protein, partial [Stenotrophomonas lactitubi]
MSNKPAKASNASRSTSIAGISDRQALRERARQNIKDGAITDSYSADRKVVIKLLNDALATEYVCVLRYYRHYFMAKGMLADAVKAEFLEHAQQEQAHAGKLAERIVQLGGEPDLNPDTLTARSHAEYKEGSDLRDMVRENLVAERIAIDSYREMINFIGDSDTT